MLEMIQQSMQQFLINSINNSPVKMVYSILLMWMEIYNFIVLFH